MQERKYQGSYLTITEETIDNHLYERVQLRKGVHVIPMQENKVLLMREHRPHEKADRWKLVSGWCDKEGKTPLEHAIEEFSEEVGMKAEAWEEIYDTVLPNATINHNTHYFLCTGITPDENRLANPDNGEVLEYQWLTRQEILTLLYERKMWLDTGALLILLEFQKNNT